MLLFNPSLEVIRGFISFPRSISPKLNVITRLEFELTYFEATVPHIKHDATETPQFVFLFFFLFFSFFFSFNNDFFFFFLF